MGMIFLSEDACGPLRRALEETGHEVFTVRPSDVVGRAIAAHPDIYMCRIKNILTIDDSIVTEPDIRAIYIEELQERSESFAEKPIIPSVRTEGTEGRVAFEMGHLGPEYPEDAAYNAAAIGRFFIHNTRWTSPALLDRARAAGLDVVSVRQGYTKCSCVTVGERALITADEGILRTLRAYNEEVLQETGDAGETLDLLQIEGGHVRLEGYEYGFLGGASGCVENTVYFNGDLSAHPDCRRICDFIEGHGLHVRYFEGEPLTDIGSVIWLP